MSRKEKIQANKNKIKRQNQRDKINRLMNLLMLGVQYQIIPIVHLCEKLLVDYIYNCLVHRNYITVFTDAIMDQMKNAKNAPEIKTC